MTPYDSIVPIALSSRSWIGEERARDLYDAARHIESDGIPGVVVECGVADGASAAFLVGGLSTPRDLWLYDLWTGGMPPPGPMDSEPSRAAEHEIGGTLGPARGKMDALGYPDDRIIYRQGLFADTFQQPLPELVSILHIDCDWYDSVSLCLDTFYDRVPGGGVIVLDDFGCFEGVVKAFYDWIRKRPDVNPLLMTRGRGHAVWLKGKETNWYAYPF